MLYRKHLRLKEFDYRSPNYYFVTICTKNRERLFYPKIDPRFEMEIQSNVAAGLVPAKKVTPRNKITDVVEESLINEIPIRYGAEIDFYVFMPDHIHFIISVSGDHKGRSYTLSEIIGGFKSITTRAVWSIDLRGRLFQPNFYEHIIRNEKSLDRIRRYIVYNPLIEYEDIPWSLIDPS